MIKKIFKNPYFWAFIAGIFSLHLIKEVALRRRQAPEALVMVKDWTLMDQDSKIFGQRDLLGKPSIASFFFTSCPTICPKLMQQMKEVHKRFVGKEDKINFFSISVDPEQDTPEVLKNYMQNL